MYIRSLPQSRRSKNKRPSGRWIRCELLDHKWVHKQAVIGLYLLDAGRRETERAVDRHGEPVALEPRSSEADLIHAIRPYGAGRYRLVARNKQGRILARRDFVAAIFAGDLDAPAHAPRTEVERLKAELASAREAAASALTERDAARAEAEELNAAIAERDAQIVGLESALERQGEALRRARRLYAELGRDGREELPDDPGADDAPDAGRLHRRTATRRSPEARPRANREAKPLGLGRAEIREIVGMAKDLIRDMSDGPERATDGGDGPDDEAAA